nr:septation ring formation regulator EzrA [Lentilactobacillus senioris]
MDRTNQLIEDVEDQVKSIQAGLVQLQDLDKQHNIAITDLEKQYQDLRQQLLEQNEKLGPSIDALEKMLANIEDQFDEFTTLTKKGDHDSAETILSELNATTDQLKDYMEIIPGLNQELQTEFPEQIQELGRGGYQMITQQGFNFENDTFETQLEHVKTQVKQNNDNLAALNVDVAKDVNIDISHRIDHLYQFLEDAIEDKKIVDEKVTVIAKYIDHLRRQNTDLTRKLERLNIDYVLDHKEIENNRQYTEQIRAMGGMEAMRQKEAIQRGQAVYSRIRADQQQIMRNLEQIEASQKELYNQVIDLPAEEEQARQTLRKFDLEMRNKKRRIDNHNLPGMPSDYSNSFNAVIKEIERLSQALNQPKVDVEEVSKQELIIQSDMDNLEEMTTKLIDDAVLAEESLQFANRFINTDPDIAAASKKAHIAFDHDFNYTKSLATIATALESQYPGSYQKIEQEYFAAKAPVTNNESQETEE